MPKMTTCTLNGKSIDVNAAIDMRDSGGDPDFRCNECNKPVHPHRPGVGSAHFQHLERNKECSLSDVWR